MAAKRRKKKGRKKSSRRKSKRKSRKARSGQMPEKVIMHMARRVKNNPRAAKIFRAVLRP